MKRNEMAKADEVSREAMRYFDYLRRDSERADVLQTRGRILVSRGYIAEGYQLLDSGAQITQRIFEENESKSVAAASCARDIAAERMRIESERHQSAMISVCIVACVISRILAIRPESVKQGRWRLRTKMGLSKSDSLEEVISTYLTTL